MTAWLWKHVDVQNKNRLTKKESYFGSTAENSQASKHQDIECRLLPCDNLVQTIFQCNFVGFKQWSHPWASHPCISRWFIARQRPWQAFFRCGEWFQHGSTWDPEDLSFKHHREIGLSFEEYDITAAQVHKTPIDTSPCDIFRFWETFEVFGEQLTLTDHPQLPRTILLCPSGFGGRQTAGDSALSGLQAMIPWRIGELPYEAWGICSSSRIGRPRWPSVPSSERSRGHLGRWRRWFG